MNYMYFGNHQPKETGVVTVAYELKTIYSKCTHSLNVFIGVAFCSPKDHFNKKRGRQIAEGRLRSPKSCIVRQIRYCTYEDCMEEIVTIAINEAMYRSDPSNSIPRPKWMDSHRLDIITATSSEQIRAVRLRVIR